ncbi:PCFT-like protein [Mya arenaria]|uniref:PCFT-like protein n=1 Tax=Mya arenaria TaxID=6604 RepID=A0ABY7F8R0_MYAAR|nr:PCFT-like protein [Mya arenaria]
MGGFELSSANGETNEQHGNAPERNEGPSTRNRTWRNWLIGAVGFFYFGGAQMGLFVIGQYIYRRIQIEAYPNKTFQTGISYCDYNNSNPDVLLLAGVQKKAAHYNVIFNIASGIPAVFVNIVIGSYTDRFGRKFLMVAAMSGTFIRVLICMIGAYTTMKIEFFAIAFGAEGLSGSVFCYLLASYAYVADITTAKNRAFGIVANEVAIGLGHTLSVVAAGFVIQAIGFNQPFIVALVCIAVAITICVVLLPESYPKEMRAKPSQTCVTLKHAVGFYYASWNYGFRWRYIVAIVVFYFTMFDVLGRNSVETLYQMNAPFCWSPTKLGLFGAVRSLLQQIFGMFVIAILKRLSMEDDTIAIVGCVSYGISFVIEGFAKTDVMLYVGSLAAGISAVETFCQMTSNVITNAFYKATVASRGGAVFFLMAGFNIISLILMLFLKFVSRGDAREKRARNYSITPISFVEKQHL